MKKNYIAPVVITVKVNTVAHLCLNSVEGLRGEASSSAVGLSREGRGNAWDDEE